MKKVLIKILCGILAIATLLSFSACKDEKWGGTSMKTWGEVESVGGFIAETENYIYYLNGIASSTAKNSFGAPVKGALMAADKSDLSKTEIVVPKLFASTDYSAGVYIFGNYVYYGTPSTDKNPDGTIANSEMMFMRTKLDGTDSKVLFTVGDLSTEFRMVEKDGDVYIVYYDKDQTALISYNATKGSKTVIAKTDEKTSGNESLDAYTFLENDALDEAVVIYTVTVYREKYNQDKIDDTAGARATQNYNKVYAYKVGDVLAEGAEVVGDCIYDGEIEAGEDGDTYAISLATDEYVFYTKTDRFGAEKHYGLSIEDFVGKKSGVEIVSEYAVATNVIESLDKVYVLEEGKVFIDTLVKDKEKQTVESKVLVAVCDTIGTMLFVKDNDLYYYNSSNQIARFELGNQDAKEIRISEDTASLTWYDPELIEIGDKEYIFYCDNSSVGLSYVRYVDIDAEVIEEDTDDDDKADKFYIKNSTLIGKITNADKADMYEAKVKAYSSKLDDGNLVFDIDENGDYKLDDGKLQVSGVKELRDAYEALSSPVKEEVTASTLNTLKQYEKAIEMANVFFKLEGIKDYDDLTENQQNDIKDAYNSIKSEVLTYYQSDYKAIDALIKQDLKANFTKAQTLFEKE